jgi:hypothetical protein
MKCERCNAATSIATHATFSAIAIKILHEKISICLRLKQYEAIGSYAKSSVTKSSN